MRNVIYFSAILSIMLLASCQQSPLVFEIGESRESVIKTLADDFLFKGESWDTEKVLDRENGNHITLYDCEYKGQYYRKFRVYYRDDKVRKLEIKIPKGKCPTLIDELKGMYGTPHKARLRYFLYTYVDALVYMSDECAVIVIEQSDEYEILLVSGEDKEKLNQEL